MTGRGGSKAGRRQGGRPKVPQLDDPTDTVEIQCWCQARIVTIGIASFVADRGGTCGQKWCRPAAPAAPNKPAGLARTGGPERTSAPKTRKPPAKVGQAARRRRKSIGVAYLLVDRRSAGICEARISLEICRLTAVEHHHIGKQSVWPELRAEPDNIRHVCRPCHDWIDAHQDQAADLGLHVSRKSDAGRAHAERFGIHP